MPNPTPLRKGSRYTWFAVSVLWIVLGCCLKQVGRKWTVKFCQAGNQPHWLVVFWGGWENLISWLAATTSIHIQNFSIHTVPNIILRKEIWSWITHEHGSGKLVIHDWKVRVQSSHIKRHTTLFMATHNSPCDTGIWKSQFIVYNGIKTIHGHSPRSQSIWFYLLIKVFPVLSCGTGWVSRCIACWLIYFFQKVEVSTLEAREISKKESWRYILDKVTWFVSD